MKKLIFVCGANGIGKSTACKRLFERLDKSALVDSDFCRLINPFEFSEELKETNKKNMAALLVNYLNCPAVENLIYLYGFHGPRKQIFDNVMKELEAEGIPFLFIPIILECELDENIKRAKADNRDFQRIEYGIKNTRELYKQYDYPRIDVTNLTVDETVDKLIELINAV